MGYNVEKSKKGDKKAKSANSVKVSFKRLTALDLEKRRSSAYKYVI